MAVDFIAPDFDGAELRVGIVQARFNEWAGRGTGVGLHWRIDCARR
jgi:hypothetical protein